MKLDDFLDADNTSDDGPIDQDIINALAAHGFVTVSYKLTRPAVAYVGTITAYRADGTFVQWQGTGATDAEAEQEAIDALAGWALIQPSPTSTP